MHKPLQTGREIPNFRVMTCAELYGLSLTEHELAGVARYILDLQLGQHRIIEAEFIVRDLATARTSDMVAALKQASEAYVDRVFAGRSR